MIEVTIKVPDPPKGFVYDCCRRAVKDEYFCQDDQWKLCTSTGTTYEWPVAIPAPPEFDLAAIKPGEAQLPMHCVTRCGDHVVILGDNWVVLTGCAYRWTGIDSLGHHVAWINSGSYYGSGRAESADDIVGPWESK